jgi:ATP-dependent helicase/nuclease subunit A
MQKHFSTFCYSWENVRLSTSFRSGKSILNVVDAVFETNANGLGENIITHTAHHNFKGIIQVLPFIEEKTTTIDPWPIFESYIEVDEPEHLLAESILNHLEHTINNSLFLESEKRQASWNDVMILMRKRGRQMQALTDLCEKKRIPYSAFDSKNLMECLVVRDMLSAVEFMLMPLNDLNLAQLLKSPWIRSFGIISEDDLFELCHNRKGSLWHEVQNQYPIHTQALNELLQATPSSAYDYFQCAYDVMNVECDLLHNFMDDVFKRFHLLNLDIRELVEHLYNYPPMYTQTHHQKGLKLSTVHGAKGLEAPIVVILDNGEEPSLKQDTVLYDPVAQFWFLKPPMTADTILTTALKEHHQQALEFEHNRLFYVALTRAKEHLILAGLPHEYTPNSWYWRVSKAMNI